MFRIRLGSLCLLLLFFSHGNCNVTESTATTASPQIILTPSTTAPTTKTILTTTSTTTIDDSTLTVPTSVAAAEISATFGPGSAEATTTTVVDNVRLYSELTALRSALHGVTGELERFQGLYMKTMDAKLMQLNNVVMGMDANIKALQDRAHVWEIFKHHIDAWSDHMTSVEKKLDLIKRSHETSFAVDGKLSALEAKTNHVYERVDMVNEKMHDMLKILYQQNIQKPSATVVKCDNTSVSRLASIEKQITLIQTSHCKTQGRRGKTSNHDVFSQPMVVDTSVKEFKQLLAVNKKSLNTLDYLGETVTTLNSTVNRMQKNLNTCCRNNEVRVTMLRDSVDGAFQKLEKIYLNLESSLQRESKLKNRTKIELEDPGTGSADSDEDQGSGSGSGDLEGMDVKPTKQTTLIKKLPFRSHCHELKGQESGIYAFGFGTDDINEQGRKFNHRYCHFDRDGSPGWTVIQRRGEFGDTPRLDFNRSWADYKNGFGELDKEFWFGNDFIHQLTNDEGQVGLRIDLEDFRGQRGVVQYSRFYVSSERSFYRLDVQGFGGNVSDALLYHNQMYFSTFDSANDRSGDIPCALSHGSGWWWNNCLESNLNGRYFEDPLASHFTGIIWEHWLGDYSLKATEMMVRPVSPNGLWIDDDDDEDADEVDDGPLSPPEDP